MITAINKFRRIFEKGVTFDDQTNTYNFDFNQDHPDDVMHLEPMQKRTKIMEHDGIKYHYYYCYHFEDGRHPGFLRAVKYIDNISEDDAFQLVDQACVDIDSKYELNEYSTILYPQSSSKILSLFANQLKEQSHIETMLPNSFVKNSVDQIQLDEEAVSKLPEATQKQVRRVFANIRNLTTEFKLKDVFTRFRKFIKNFIKLEHDITSHVTGKKVILMDDYHTTGATMKEMMNILFALKPTEIFVVILIKVK